METPKIDSRDAREIYAEALTLAKQYCPEWDPEVGKPGVGEALLKLFTRLAEILTGQLNRIPEKHRLAFYDFIGMDHLPPAAAKAPLTFKLSTGGKTASVPARTKAASSRDATAVFETLEPLTVARFDIKEAYSVNPWEDRYTGHSLDENDTPKGFTIFGGDEAQKPLDHLLYLDDDLFNFKTPADLTIKFWCQNEPGDCRDYFAKVGDGAGKQFNAVHGVDQNKKTVTAKLTKVLVPKTVVNGREGNWISFRPGIPLPVNSDTVTPVIDKITCDLTMNGIHPEVALLNNTMLDLKKGFYPFGETPKNGDCFYLGSEEAFSKTGATIRIQIKESLFPVMVENLAASLLSARKDLLLYNSAQRSLALTKRITLAEKNDLLSLSTDSSYLKAIADLYQMQDIQLSWEYWNGAEWENISGVTDTTRNLTGSGKIVFSCPAVEPVALSGITTRWVRARIENSRGYGQPGYYKKAGTLARMSNVQLQVNSNLKLQSNTELISNLNSLQEQLQQGNTVSGYIYEAPAYKPPFINSLTIQCECRDRLLQRIVRNHDFSYQNIKPRKSFQPFLAWAADRPQLYLGFEGEPANQPLNLYFSLQTKVYGQAVTVLREPGYDEDLNLYDKIRSFSWKYFNGSQWLDLAVADGTGGFTKNGVVQSIIPADIAKNSLFGRTGLYWLRIEPKEGRWLEAPGLKGIFPNTVWAENAVVVKNELLGSSNGRPNQEFQFLAKPLLAGQIIEVREPGIPGVEEMERIAAQTGPDSVLLVKNDSGDVEEVWVRWSEARSFEDSGPASRHYIMDRINGRILFGDGVKGMIPPALPGNIRAKEYHTGGGTKGYQPAEAVNSLRTTIPNIEAVMNHDPTSGGRDGETLTGLLQRAPHFLRSGSRAVTAEDFEWLAREASAEVSRVKCIREKNGTLKVIIVPAYLNERPVPESSLADEVENYLKERAFAPIADTIEVIGPAYQAIDLETTVVPLSFAESTRVALQVEQRLREFLDPVAGGPDGAGWDFGRDLFLSEVAAVIEEVPGVDFLADLRIKKEKAQFPVGPMNKMSLAIAGNELPCAGKINVKLWGGKINADSIA